MSEDSDLFEVAPDSEKEPEIANIYLPRLVKEGERGEEEEGREEYAVTPSLVKRISPKKAYFQCHKTFSKWLHLDPPDHEAIDVVLAAAIDRDVPGDPVWLFIIAPSGGMKTEVCRSLGDYKKTYSLSSLTTKTFISGKVFKNKKTGNLKVGGLLPRLNDKVLVIKDFTVILSLRDVERYEIFGQLRDIHDGYMEKAFGNIDFTVRIHSSIGLVAGVTPAIDKHQKMATMLGERFLKVRQHPDGQRAAERAHQNTGKEDEMRGEISTAVNELLSNIDFENIPKLTDEQSAEIINMAGYISLMRAWVFCKYYQGRIFNLDPAEPEVPTRAAKQLGKLAVALALIRSHPTVTEEDMNTIRRVTRDTALPKRQRIIDGFGAVGWDTVADLASFSGMQFNTANNEIEKMQALGILKVRTEIDDPKNKESVTFFEFTPTFKPLVESVKPREVEP